MAGAVTHSWPDNVRNAIVRAVISDRMSQLAAIRAAAAGELDGCPRLGDRTPARTTVAGWVQLETERRNREAARITGGKAAHDIADGLLAEIVADVRAEVAERQKRRTNVDVDRYQKLIGLIRQACPDAGKRPRTHTPEPSRPEKDKPTKDDTPHAASLAEQIAARARATSTPTPTDPGTQEPTPTTHNATNHDHNDTTSLVAMGE